MPGGRPADGVAAATVAGSPRNNWQHGWQ